MDAGILKAEDLSFQSHNESPLLAEWEKLSQPLKMHTTYLYFVGNLGELNPCPDNSENIVRTLQPCRPLNLSKLD